jgi:hypothetical protein
MKYNLFLSKREFSVGISTPDGTIENFNLVMADLFAKRDNEFEVIYSLQEQIDKVLDLQRGQSMYFQPNRDDNNSKGIITRFL